MTHTTPKPGSIHTRALLASSVLALSAALLTPSLHAQQPGNGPPPPRNGNHDRPDRPGGRPGPDQGGGRDENRILPPGAWWTNPDVIAKIGLSTDQRAHIETIFSQSRIGLARLHESLEELQISLEPMLEANPIDQAKALAQINRIADQRAELEKANARMLLSIRSVLTADQWSKLRTGPHPPPPPHER